MSQSLVEFELWRKSDWTRRDVVGESFHAEAIRSLFPPKIPDDRQELFLRATLTPDPGNAHDRNAVKVLVAGHHVGHLSRDDAAVYQPVLSALMHRGFLPTTKCRVWGSEYERWVGSDRRGRDIMQTQFSSSVSVTLDEWYLCVPINEPPGGAHTMLPQGAAIQVRKEENHQDILRRYVNRHGESWVYGTLHSVVEQTARTSKELVEIRIDGQRVGELTPAMSADYLPVIAKLGDLGRSTGVRMVVKGNQVKAEVVLHATKAHQLEADWIAAHLDGQLALAPVASASSQTHSSRGAPSTSTMGRIIEIPPKPRVTFSTPPGWPPPPTGWEPSPEWRPDPTWPPAPEGWEFWRVS